MKRFTILLTIFICIFLAGCKQVVVRDQIEVTATVTEKSYTPSYTSFVSIYHPTLKTITLSPIIHSEKHLITISYKHISNTFDDKKLYENVNQGDSIQMILYKDHDKLGQLVDETLQFRQPQYLHLNEN